MLARICVSSITYLDHKRPSKTLTPDYGISGGQGGYASNFGSGLSGGPESAVIAAVFKTLVTRLVDSLKDLKSQENIALYCDVRQLVTYVKGAHGGPFRRVALSGVLAVTPRPNKQAPTMQTTRVIRYGFTVDIQKLFNRNEFIFLQTDIFLRTISRRSNRTKKLSENYCSKRKAHLPRVP